MLLLDNSVFAGPGIALAIIAGILIVVTIVAVARSYGRKPSAGRETLIGRIGTVRTPLQPEGAVHVDGELWQAMTEGSHIDAGTRVVITSIEGLKLTVRKKEE